MIDTVLFDMGGTLEDIVSTPLTLTLAAQRITQILAAHGLPAAKTPGEMEAILSQGLKLYGRMRDVNHIELKPERIWPEYMLRGLRLEGSRLEPISEELAFAWENCYFNRSLRPGVIDMLEGLSGLGLKLGIISNTASLYQVFDQLERYGIRGYFRDVTLSSQVGYRKPHPGIFQISLLQLRSEPQHCVYVGDTLSRDVLGAKRAGFACAILIHSQLTSEKDEALQDAPVPDFRVQAIGDVLTVCRDLRAVPASAGPRQALAQSSR
ncbi:MAG: HAD-IA family hydrolase [Christensenellales bacterium]